MLRPECLCVSPSIVGTRGKSQTKLPMRKESDRTSWLTYTKDIKISMVKFGNVVYTYSNSFRITKSIEIHLFACVTYKTKFTHLKACSDISGLQYKFSNSA